MEKFTGTPTYIASEELQQSVQIAAALGRPLLLKGEPGTGKTMLAEAIAESRQMPLYIWSIKSTTRAQDGLYVYDTVQRLYDSQFGNAGVEDIRHYIRLGKLGEALVSPKPSILLIDEIDKADLEFPNDLLWELDKMEFFIPETGETIRAIHRPLVIITSNAEKELPDAFLRRCIFHYIEFPEPEMMERIVKTKFPHLEDTLCQQAITAFYALRQVPELAKRPSTAELLDWIQALLLGEIEPQKLAGPLPFIGVLLKKTEDLQKAGY